MTPIDPGLARNQRQVIDLLSQHKLEWRSIYGIQELSLFGSLARNEAIPGSDVDLCVMLGVRVDVVTRWPGTNPVLKQEIERDAISI
jgi:predicted nucleotidyltransferase